MISTTEFQSHTLREKQALLLALFSQIENPSQELVSIVELLESDFVFSSQALDGVYDMIANAVRWGQEQTNISIDEQVHKTHTLLLEEAEQMEKDADSLLETL